MYVHKPTLFGPHQSIQKNTHTVWVYFPYILVELYGKVVEKYTNPMDPMGIFVE